MNLHVCMLPSDDDHKFERSALKNSDSGAVLHEQAGLAAHAEGPSVQAGEVGARGVEGLASQLLGLAGS